MINRFLIRKIVPRIAGVLAIVMARSIPSLEGAEEPITTALLAVWGVIEIVLMKNHSDRQELVSKQQLILKGEGLYMGKIDGKAGPKYDSAVREAAGRAAAGNHPAKS